MVSRPMRNGAMFKLSKFIRRLEQHRLPVHINPVVRQMIETIAEALPFPNSHIFKQLLNPYLTESILKILGESGRNLEPLFKNTINPTIVNGGEKINVIPSKVIVYLDGRLLPGFTPDDMIAELRRIVGNEIELEIFHYESNSAKVDMGLFKMLADILNEADPKGIPLPLLLPAITDGRHFAKLGIQSYGFMPMRLPPDFNFFDTIHAADERIPTEALDFGADAIYKLLQRY